MNYTFKILSLLLGFTLLEQVAMADMVPDVAGSPTTMPTTATTPLTGQDLIDPSAATKPTASGGSELTDLSLEDLMNVQVTSVSKKKESIADAPAAVSVISQDDIARSGFSTIPDLLRLSPGVDVGRINSYTWAVGVRGLNDEFNDKLLVLQDGRTVYSPLFGGVYWDTVDYVLEDLDRIEVIRGPGATLWGSNAVNGVINITSKDSRDTQGWLESARGSNDDSDLSLRYGGRLSDDTTYRVYLKSKYDNELDTPDGTDAGDDWYSMRGGFRIDKHPDANNTLTLQGDVGNNQIREPIDIPVTAAPFVAHETSDRSDTSGNVLARWDHRDGDDSDFSLQAYYDYLKVSYVGTVYDQNTFDLDFHHRFKLGSQNEVTWGLGYRLVNSEFDTTPIASADPPIQNSNLYSAFVQDTYTIQPDRWFFTLGSKLEHNDFTGFEVQPSARLLWTPDKQNSVWASVSRATRTPTLVETDIRTPAAYTSIPTGPGTSSPGEVVVLGNHDEQSEELVSYELGYRVQPTRSCSVDTSLFYNNYNRLQTIDNEAPIAGLPIILPLRFGNHGEGDTYGGEISAAWQATDRWRLVGSYSLLKASFHSSDPASTPLTDATSTPENQAQIRSYYDITKNLQFNVSVFYVGGVSEFNVPGYISTDLNIAWQPSKAMEFKLGVLNLFDSERSEFGVTGGQGIASETPRTLYAEMSYRF